MKIYYSSNMANGSAARSVVDIVVEEIEKIADVQKAEPVAQTGGANQQTIMLEITLFHMSKSFVVDDSGLPHGYSERLGEVLARLQREHGVIISTATDYAPAQPLIMQMQRYFF